MRDQPAPQPSRLVGFFLGVPAPRDHQVLRQPTQQPLMKTVLHFATLAAALATLTLSTSTVWAQNAVTAASAKKADAVVTASGLV